MQRQIQVVGEHEDGPLVRFEASERPLELVARLEVTAGRGTQGHADLQRRDVAGNLVECPAARRAGLIAADIHEDSSQPGLHPLRVAQPPDVSPGVHERLLHGVLRSELVAQDEAGDRGEPAGDRGSELRKGSVVAAPSSLREVLQYLAAVCLSPATPGTR